MVSKGLCLNASRLMSCLSNARMPLFMLSLLKTLVSSYRWLCLWMLLLPQKEKEKYPNTTLMYFLCLYFLILEVKLMCIHGNVGTFSSWAIYKPKTIDFRLILPPPPVKLLVAASTFWHCLPHHRYFHHLSNQVGEREFRVAV